MKRDQSGNEKEKAQRERGGKIGRRGPRTEERIKDKTGGGAKV